MFVRFTGADAHLIPSLALEMQPGQIVEVPEGALLPPVYEPVDVDELATALTAISVAAGKGKPPAKSKETKK